MKRISLLHSTYISIEYLSKFHAYILGPSRACVFTLFSIAIMSISWQGWGWWRRGWFRTRTRSSLTLPVWHGHFWFGSSMICHGWCIKKKYLVKFQFFLSLAKKGLLQGKFHSNSFSIRSYAHGRISHQLGSITMVKQTSQQPQCRSQLTRLFFIPGPETAQRPCRTVTP